MNNKYFINKSKHNNKNNDKDIEKTKKHKKTRVHLVKRECIDYDMFKFLIRKIKGHEEDDEKMFNLILLNSLLYYTGLRISEVLLINKKNLVELFEKEKYNAYCPKTKTRRLIYLDKETKEDLLSNFDFDCDDKNYIEKERIFFDKLSDEGLINLYKNKLNLRTAYLWMDKYFKLLTYKFSDNKTDLGGSPFSFHSYRTNFINKVCRSSDMDTAADLIGHKDASTTFIYWRKYHVDDNKNKQILSKAILKKGLS